MTNPETEFGEALRRAFSGAAEVEPDGEALQRIRARARVSTPKRRLDAFLAIIIPWRAYQLLQYRTMAADALAAAWSWSVDATKGFRQWSAPAREVGRGWLVGETREVGRGWLVGETRHLRAWTAASARRARGWAASSASRTREWSGGWPATARDRLLTTARDRVVVPVRDRLVAPARAWLSPTPAPATETAGAQPRHADSSPPPSRIGWLRPALAVNLMMHNNENNKN